MTDKSLFFCDLQLAMRSARSSDLPHAPTGTGPPQDHSEGQKEFFQRWPDDAAAEKTFIKSSSGAGRVASAARTAGR